MIMFRLGWAGDHYRQRRCGDEEQLPSNGFRPHW
jgi:hypothetical protein